MVIFRQDVPMFSSLEHTEMMLGPSRKFSGASHSTDLLKQNMKEDFYMIVCVLSLTGNDIALCVCVCVYI